MTVVQPSLLSTPAKPAIRGRSRVGDQRDPLPRCCSNCWRMKTRLDGRDGLAYACLEDARDRASEVGELDGGMILESMGCPEWRSAPGSLRDGIEQIESPRRAMKYAEQIELMKEWNRGHN